jgi:hypothetical protein
MNNGISEKLRKKEILNNEEQDILIRILKNTLMIVQATSQDSNQFNKTGVMNYLDKLI